MLKKLVKFNYKKVILLIILSILSFMAGAGIEIAITNTEEGVKIDTSYTLEFSDIQVPAQLVNDQGEIVEDENIPTLEEVDGGQFKDKDTGVSVIPDKYSDLGWVETYDVSTPEAFKNDTLNKCIIANNIYGAQCVSLARVFWWSYADRDVTTCGTGRANGMMSCWPENAGDDFEVYFSNDKEKIQAGDWLVFDGGKYGHIGMALGGYNNGYVALLGENQGGKSCKEGGSATNIINISLKNLIGFYRPEIYIKKEPVPEILPITGCLDWNVKKGDTMSKIMLDCEGIVKYGEAMDSYAKTWYSTIYNPGKSVYDGWASKRGVGLFVGDFLEHRVK